MRDTTPRPTFDDREVFTPKAHRLVSEGPVARSEPPPEAGPRHRHGTASGSARRGRASTSRAGGRKVLAETRALVRSEIAAVAAFSVFVNLLMLTVPIYLFQLSDRVLTSRSLDTLVMLTIVAVGLLAVLVALDSLRRLVLMRVGTQLETQLGGPVLATALASADVSAQRDVQALRDLQQVRSFVTSPVMLVLFDAPLAPLYFLAVFLIHPHLGMITAVAGAVLFVLAWANERATAREYGTASTHAVRAGVQAQAQARNAQVVCAMGMVEESIRLWGRDAALSLKAQVTASDRNVHLATVSRFLRLLTQIALLGWGAYLALAGEITGGMMIASSLIASRALAPVETAIEGWRSLVQAKGAWARVRTLLEGAGDQPERIVLPRPEGRLSIERLLFVPPGTKRPVVNGISFALEPGDSLAIVGPSGGGKSTLARMLVGCVAPTAGHVRLDFMDLRNWDRQQLGRTIGYLPQDIELFPGTIKQNIARMRDDVPDEMITRAAELAGVHEMISMFPNGYETEIASDGSPLSGGQKQQIALARAFFGSPRLLVLDEPNANLDAAGEAALDRALMRARELGVTVVVVTQRPAVLRSVNRILLVQNGQVAGFGERDQMLARLGRPPQPEPISPPMSQTPAQCPPAQAEIREIGGPAMPKAANLSASTLATGAAGLINGAV